MSLERAALDLHAAMARAAVLGDITEECPHYFFSTQATAVCFSITDFFPPLHPCSRIAQGLLPWGDTGETLIATLGVSPPFSSPSLSLTLFGAEIGLSLFRSYGETHSLVLVGLPVTGIAPTSQPD